MSEKDSATKCLNSFGYLFTDYKPKFAQPFGRKRDRDDFDDRSSRGGDRYERGSERYERGSDRYSSRHRGSIDSPSDRYSERSVRHEPLSPRSNQGI